MTLLEGPRPPGRPCWLDLSVPDVHAVAGFYARLFGWTYDVSGPEYGHYHLAMVDGRPVAGIGQPMPGASAPTAWALYLAADDADAAAARAQALGGSVVAPAFEVPGYGRLAMVADPTGVVVGLWQALRHTGFGVAGVPGSLAWFDLNTRDAQRAAAFYTAFMGAETRATEMAGTPYLVLHQDGHDVGGILQMNEQWGDMPPSVMVYLRVADADAAAATALAAGAKVPYGVFDVAYGRIAVVFDPAGAAFSLWQPRDA